MCDVRMTSDNLVLSYLSHAGGSLCSCHFVSQTASVTMP